MKANNKITFARWGSINSHFYDMRDENGDKKDGFNTPPVKRGIYAFIWPYIEPFLVAWNSNVYKETGSIDEYGLPKKKFTSIKKFTHDGDLWCHFTSEARKLCIGKKYVGSWVMVETRDLPLLLKKDAHEKIKILKECFPDMVIKNPYKVGQNGCMSRDHLEVFIENVKN